jgi:hypothetical protein
MKESNLASISSWPISMMMLRPRNDGLWIAIAAGAALDTHEVY